MTLKTKECFSWGWGIHTHMHMYVKKNFKSTDGKITKQQREFVDWKTGKQLPRLQHKDTKR